jgi:hypothetical protein
LQGVYGVVKVVSCICFLLFMADSLGRRRSLLVSSVGQSLCMFYIGLYMRISPPVQVPTGVEPPPLQPQGYVAVACIFIFAAFFQFGWGPACWIYVSEIPTARLRPMNVALAVSRLAIFSDARTNADSFKNEQSSTQWLFNFIIARGLPNMLVTMAPDGSGYGAYLMFGCFGIVMYLFVWFLVPETKGVSLERMDELFGVTAEDRKEVLGEDRPQVGVEIREDDRKDTAI